LSPGELSRLSAEFRLLVEAILRIERSKPAERPAQKPSLADELRARRAARHAEYQRQAIDDKP
jgi:hypothetical protein